MGKQAILPWPVTDRITGSTPDTFEADMMSKFVPQLLLGAALLLLAGGGTPVSA